MAFDQPKPVSMHRIHRSIASRAGPGSGTWLLASDEYISWQQTPGSKLWCSGKPGVGKTVMASIIHENLKNASRTRTPPSTIGCAVVYFNRNKPAPTLANLLEDIIRQIQACLDSLEHHPVCLCNISTNPRHLLNTLIELTKLFQDIFIVIDALDESLINTPWQLLDRLLTVGDKMHLLVTSRPSAAIEAELEGFSQLDIKANELDLKIYVDQQVNESLQLTRLCTDNEALRSEVVHAVIGNAKESFLLARLHMNSLAASAALSGEVFQDTLHALPDTLLGAHMAALKRIYDQGDMLCDIAITVLIWLNFALRPLKVVELQHALAISGSVRDTFDRTLLTEPSVIIASCAGLVTVDTASETITFVHDMTARFVSRMCEDCSAQIHLAIAMRCAKYLALPALTVSDHRVLKDDYPLTCYAAQYMCAHAQLTAEDMFEDPVDRSLHRLLSHPVNVDALSSLLDAFALFKSGKYLFKASDVETKVENYHTMQSDDSDSASVQSVDTTDSNLPLEEDLDQDVVTISRSWFGEQSAQRLPSVSKARLQASIGLAKFAMLLPQYEPCADASDRGEEVKLAGTASCIFGEAANLVVQESRHMKWGNEHGAQIFLFMAENGWINAARSFAQYEEDESYNASIRLPRNRNGSLFAAFFGHVAALKSWLDENLGELDSRVMRSSYSLTSSSGIHFPGMTLFSAVEGEQFEVVDLLVKNGIDINSRDDAGQTSLHRAVRRGSLVLTRYLVEHGAQVNIRNDAGRTPWSANLTTGHYECLDYLLQVGADANVRGLQGVSELYDAAANRSTEVVRYMLKSGTNSSIRTKFKWTPLHCAAFNGYIDCVKLLLDAGCERSPISDQGTTPLDMAVRAGHDTIVEILIEAGCLKAVDVLVSTTEIEFKDEHQISAVWTPEKRTLAFDRAMSHGMAIRQCAYPISRADANDAIYRFSMPLGGSNETMSVRKSSTATATSDHRLFSNHFDFDNTLFTVSRDPSKSATIKLHTKQQATWSGFVEMERVQAGHWKVCQHAYRKHLRKFRMTPDWSPMRDHCCRWSNHGVLLARTGVSDAAPWLTFEPDTQQEEQDIILACWSVKLWAEKLLVP